MQTAMSRSINLTFGLCKVQGADGAATLRKSFHRFAPFKVTLPFSDQNLHGRGDFDSSRGKHESKIFHTQPRPGPAIM